MKNKILIFALIFILFVSLFKNEHMENKEQNIVTIILTTTVNVDTKIDNVAQNQSDIRKGYYLKAVRNWLKNTELNIVIVENSGYTYPELATEITEYASRFEIISFKESEQADEAYLVDYHDKGAHEFYAIDYAIKHSKLAKQSNFIVKITGRYYIPGFENFIKDVPLENYLALRQSNGNRCEMVGSHMNYTSTFFNPDMGGDTGVYAEALYAARIGQIPDEKVLVCPVFEIEETLQGSNNNKHMNLFSNKQTI
jgi:hypothetical protein